MVDEIDQFIAENGGSARDALNVALARLKSLTVDYDALTYQLRERDEVCQSQGAHNCPMKLRTREGMGNL